MPDTNWIVEHGAFWDFCYEHCNYFTGDSLGNALMAAGFARPHSSRTAFGGQYVWVETFNASRRTAGLVADGLPRMSQKLAEYARTEAATISRVGERLHGLKSGGSSIAIWGMATKGTIFACLLDPTRTLFDFCVDINTNKQGGFVPLTGHRIDAPEVLSATNSRPLVVVVMNSNYASEIKERCRALALEPVVIDANSNEL